jgi:TonB family protein
MGRLHLFTATGSQVGLTIASVGSVALHGMMAFVVLGVLGVPSRQASAPAARAERQVDVEVVAAPPLDSQDVHRDVVSDQRHDHPHAAPHSHPYPLPPDHDATPHSPEIDHRVLPGAPAEPPRVVVASAPARPTFAIALGRADATTGGSFAAGGAGDGSGRGSQNGSADAAAPARDDLFVDADVSAHARLSTPLRPDYPAAARAQGIEATVTLEIIVGRDGNVAEVHVVKGAGYGFEDSAVRALGRARFTPAIRDGRPVRVRMPWTIDFRLE